MESVTVCARWTFRNWKKYHRILVDKQERFVVNLPELCDFVFFILPGDIRYNRENNVFQGYDLRVTVPCTNRTQLMATIRATATHLAELKDNSLERNNFEIDLQFENANNASETFVSQHFLEGRLGQACGRPVLHYTNPREYKAAIAEDMLTIHMSDTVYVHFQIELKPAFHEEERPVQLETYTKELYENREKLANVHLIMKNGVDIPAHSFILLANKEMLENILPQSFFTGDTTTVLVPGISSEMMELILEFVYTRQIQSVRDLSSLLKVVDMYNLKPLLQYLRSKFLNVANAADLYRLCHKFNLDLEKNSVADFIKRHAHQFLENLRLKPLLKSTRENSSLFDSFAKVPRFEKITSTCHETVKAAKAWPPKRCHHRSQEDAFSITVGKNLVTLRFYIRPDGLFLKIAQQSTQFMENRLLVDIAAHLGLDRLDSSAINAPPEVIYRIEDKVEGFLLYASQETLSEKDFVDGDLLLLDSEFHDWYRRHVTEVEFSVDVEVFLRKEDTRQKPERNDMVCLKMNDGQSLPVCKNQLSENNSVFKALFFGGLKESSENVIVISDLGSAAMLVIVEFICSGKVLPVWKQNVSEVILGASKYMVAGLLEFLDFNISSLCSTDNYLELYKLVRLYGFSRAEDEIANFVAINIDAVLENLVSEVKPNLSQLTEESVKTVGHRRNASI